MEGGREGGRRRTEQIEDIYDTRDQCMFGRKTHKTDLNAAHADTHTSLRALSLNTNASIRPRGGKKK